MKLQMNQRLSAQFKPGTTESAGLYSRLVSFHFQPLLQTSDAMQTSLESIEI